MALDAVPAMGRTAEVVVDTIASWAAKILVEVALEAIA
jgi:hypothetical protein